MKQREIVSRLTALLHGGGARAEQPAAARAWWDRDEPTWPADLQNGEVVEYLVDDRVFLLGLDELYRKAMKKHEYGELLDCARRVASALDVAPVLVPVEGYYTEHPDLTAYFRLMRALQEVPLARAAAVEAIPQFQRLLAVTSSPIFGQPVREYLLPVGRDPLSIALRETEMREWAVPKLTSAAARVARTTDDYSLVGLAARAEDPVVLAALRESVVLYAEMVVGSALVMNRPRYIWKVSPDLAAAGQRFIDAFNALFGVELPPASAEYAWVYWGSHTWADIVGRCARIGQTDPPIRFYHWAVVRGPDSQLAVREFWDDEIWTTERYRRSVRTRTGS